MHACQKRRANLSHRKILLTEPKPKWTCVFVACSFSRSNNFLVRGQLQGKFSASAKTVCIAKKLAHHHTPNPILFSPLPPFLLSDCFRTRVSWPSGFLFHENVFFFFFLPFFSFHLQYYFLLFSSFLLAAILFVCSSVADIIFRVFLFFLSSFSITAVANQPDEGGRWRKPKQQTNPDKTYLKTYLNIVSTGHLW